MDSRCNKNAYPTKERAKRYAKKRMRKDRRLNLRVYKCPDCCQWHMSHKQKKRY